MKEMIESLANNNYVIIGLSVLLAFLIILFFVLLFSKNKKKPEEVKSIDEENIVGNVPKNNIDFDHSEYVKETTAEFELTPITDVQPTPDGFVPEVKVEESPATDKNAKSIDDVPLADFNFDELSKSISEEIENLKLEEVAMNEQPEAVAPAVDTFKAVEPIKPVSVETPVNNTVTLNNNVASSANASNNLEFNEFILDTPFATPANNQSSEPVSAPEQPASVQEQPVSSSEVVSSNVQTPIFATFTQETYDINKKD